MGEKRDYSVELSEEKKKKNRWVNFTQVVFLVFYSLIEVVDSVRV